MALIFGMELTGRHGSMLLEAGYARACAHLGYLCCLWADFENFSGVSQFLAFSPTQTCLGNCLRPLHCALEPVKLPLILSGVCSLSSANYFPNPFGICLCKLKSQLR